MAHASRKHFGPGLHGKGTGHGAMDTIETSKIGANMVLSNRDKSRHSEERGLDGRAVMTEQYMDHVGNRRE